MPKHKQAGHTTVLTKMRKQHNKTLAMQEPPTHDVLTSDHSSYILQLQRMVAMN
jgi:hypothetical protein